MTWRSIAMFSLIFLCLLPDHRFQYQHKLCPLISRDIPPIQLISNNPCHQSQRPLPDPHEGGVDLANSEPDPIQHTHLAGYRIPSIRFPPCPKQAIRGLRWATAVVRDSRTTRSFTILNDHSVILVQWRKLQVDCRR